MHWLQADQTTQTEKPDHEIAPNLDAQAVSAADDPETDGEPTAMRGTARPPIEGLKDLPPATGVYVFHGNQARLQLPLYIGKSVNLRSRVLAHLREPAEQRMMAQVRRIEFMRTAGEIGALLLESKLIKERQPLYNVRLRRSRGLCSWQLAADGSSSRPTLVYSRDIEFATAPNLYGLYSSAGRAKEALLALAREHRLCLSTLGLEAASRRGCFGVQIGQCDGVCVGREPLKTHSARLLELLQLDAVQRWPFDGPVGLVERDGDWKQTHVVDRWRHVRTADSKTEDLANGNAAEAFDLDAYRILVRPLLAGSHELVEVIRDSCRYS